MDLVDNDSLVEAVTGVVAPTIAALEKLNHFGRYLHPPALPALLRGLSESEQAVREGFERFSASDIPSELDTFKNQVAIVVDYVCKAFEGLQQCSGDDPNEVFKAYQALRNYTHAVEALYPIAPMLPVVSRFFLEPDMRDDNTLAEKLAQAQTTRDDVGVAHVDNAKDQRGGFSLYVPEYYDATQALPLIMGLHGGSGHGSDFLWSWIKEARTRGAILVSPTARGRTWSLMGEDVDNPNLDKIVDYVCGRWRVDTSAMLLTGMSDGGTYTYLSGLRSESPFTHLAPCSASFHPFLLAGFEGERIKNLPIYIIHGVLDWMFSINMAREANLAFTNAGANVVYREIKDLSHTYPRDENPHITDWFLQGTEGLNIDQLVEI